MCKFTRSLVSPRQAMVDSHVPFYKKLVNTCDIFHFPAALVAQTNKPWARTQSSQSGWCCTIHTMAGPTYPVRTYILPCIHLPEHKHIHFRGADSEPTNSSFSPSRTVRTYVRTDILYIRVRHSLIAISAAATFRCSILRMLKVAAAFAVLMLSLIHI